MKPHRDHVVADGRNRIRESESFAKRKNEIQNELMQVRKEKMDAAGWLRRRLILWEIDRLSTKKAEGELCPLDALYLKSK